MRRPFFLKLFAAITTFLAAIQTAPAQTPAAAPDGARQFRIYDSKGSEARLEEVVEAMGGAEVVLIGETHDDAGAHLLEAELLQRAFARFARGEEESRRSVALSLEMFERDVQVILDEYLAGLISERHFLAAARPWRNYQTDYRPLVEFARAHKLHVIAANAPARYVSRVAQHGPASLSSLSAAAKGWLPPLPLAPASQAYGAKFAEFMRGEADRPGAPQQTAAVDANPHARPAPHQAAHGGAAHLLVAQNLRDASMAHAVAEHLKRQARPLVLHVNGTFHSEERLGVPEHLLRYRPKTRLMVVTTVPAANFDSRQMSNLGDFIVLTGTAPVPK